MRRWLTSACVLLVLAASFSPVAGRAQAPADEMAFWIADARFLPSVVGPLAGEVPIEVGVTHIEPAAVDLRDFYARAAFTNPYPADEHLWDIGLSFRRTDRDDDFRIVVDSEGAWFFKPAGGDTIASGQIEGIARGANEVNRLDLVAVGDEGHFALNGGYVATLDLSARDLSGDIAVGTGYYAEDQRDGEATPFAEFEVWSLELADDSAPEATGGGGAGAATDVGQTMIFDLFNRDEPGLYGVVSMQDLGGQTAIEIGAFEVTGDDTVAIHAGTCDALASVPAFELSPVDGEELTSETVLDVPFDDLTGGDYALVVRAEADDAAPILGCGAIPAT